jgi:15-cis-phytoene synthase
VEDRLFSGLAAGRSDDPVIAAVVDTARRYDIDHRHFADFTASMRMDLTVAEYPTYADLARYVHGSAAVIGLQVLPVLGTSVPREEAEPAAAALGVAFQLTNFLRDVGEDLDRGRVYLPLDELAAFGVDRPMLEHARRTGRADPRVRRALAHQVARTRAVYREAEPGIAMLAPRSRPCVDTAFRLYSRILDLIEEADHDVLSGRVVVSGGRRLAIALPALARSVLARSA